MSRYIEEDHLIENLYVQSDDDGYICCPVDELEEMIKAEPTTDVRPNVHGEWAKICWKAFRCSECKNISEYYTDFCPNCGADMRKGEKNANQHSNEYAPEEIRGSAEAGGNP